VLIVPIMYGLRDTPLPAFCKYICPAGTLEGGIGLLSNAVNESYFSMLGPLFTWKFLLMVSVLVSCVFIFRLFCRFICPLGALYGLFNKISLFGIKLEKSKCTDCGLCIHHCKVDIKHVGDQECISCGECIDVCPTKAISWKGSKILLKANEGPVSTDKHKKLKKITRLISAIVMVAVLFGAIAYYWNQTPVAEPIPEGNQIGDKCYSFDLKVIDGNGLTGETMDPAATGKITIINFWGTWCGPCVAELPYFHQIASEYPDQVQVVAVHSKLEGDESPSDFITKYYPDTNMTFAWDNDGDDFSNGTFYLALGGRSAYPYTVILDESGIITNLIVSAVEYQTLKNIVEGLLK